MTRDVQTVHASAIEAGRICKLFVFCTSANGRGRNLTCNCGWPDNDTSF